MDRIAEAIQQDPRFQPIVEAFKTGDDRNTILAIEASGMLDRFAYSEIAEALTAYLDTEAQEASFYHEHGQSHPTDPH